MKKEYLVLIVIIAGLSAYLFTHNDNRTHYTLPELQALTGSDITGIAIEQKGKTLQVSKKDDVWGVTEKAYPADTDKINTLIKTIKDLRITALVSEKGELQRYQLDKDHCIKVTASGASGVIRTFDVGKTAPSYNHTFVKLQGDDHVYHAAGNFRREFDVDQDALRDKKVLSFDETHIKKIELQTSGITRTLTLVEAADTASDTAPPPSTTQEGTDKAKETSPPAEEKKKTVWTFQDDSTPGDKDAVKQLLSPLSSLECDGYAADEDPKALDNTSQLCKIILTGADKELQLTLFEKKEDDNYPALSSGTPFPFVLDSYQGKNILSHVNTLLGIKEKTETSQEQ